MSPGRHRAFLTEIPGRLAVLSLLRPNVYGPCFVHATTTLPPLFAALSGFQDVAGPGVVVAVASAAAAAVDTNQPVAIAEVVLQRQRPCKQHKNK
jgi:hypothetical protein